MKETLNRGYPYPEATGDGADVSYWMQRFGEAVDADVASIVMQLLNRNPTGIASGKWKTTIAGGLASLSKTYTFTPGTFDVAPNVTVGMYVGAGTMSEVNAKITDVSASGFKLWVQMGEGLTPASGTPIEVDWIAVQCSASAT